MADDVQDPRGGVTAGALAVAAGGLALLGVALVVTRGGQQAPAPSPSPSPTPSPTPSPRPSPSPSPQPQPSPSPSPSPDSCILLEAIGAGHVCGAGACTRDQVQVCPAYAETDVYTAFADSGASFLRWEGPNGAVVTDNPVSLTAYGSGFVRGVFTPPRTPCPTSWGAQISSDVPGDGRVFVLDACGRKHWIDSGFQSLLCGYSPWDIHNCNTDVFPEGPSVAALGCCPGTFDGGCRGC